jgi:Uma2 family endonuclease
MTTTTALATIADLERHPGSCELVGGEIVMMSPTSFWHGRVTSNIVTLLHLHVRKRRLPGVVVTGETGFIWDERTVRAADVAYLTQDQARNAPERGFMPFCPPLVVEVVSPDDRWTEIRSKVRGWLAHGTALVWVVDPTDRTVDVHAAGKAPATLSGTDRIDGGSVLPGFKVKIAEFFA